MAWFTKNRGVPVVRTQGKAILFTAIAALWFGPAPGDNQALAGEPGPDAEALNGNKTDRLSAMVKDLLEGRNGDKDHIVTLDVPVFTAANNHSDWYGDDEIGYVKVGYGAATVNFNHSIDVRVGFGQDNADISPKAYAVLADVGKALFTSELKERTFIIGGHTDSNGEETENKYLSIERARAIKRYLVETFGIDPRRLIAYGFGESRFYNSKAPTSAVNRRIEITLVESCQFDGVGAQHEEYRDGSDGYAYRVDPRPYYTGLDDYGGVRTLPSSLSNYW